MRDLGRGGSDAGLWRAGTEPVLHCGVLLSVKSDAPQTRDRFASSFFSIRAERKRSWPEAEFGSSEARCTRRLAFPACKRPILNATTRGRSQSGRSFGTTTCNSTGRDFLVIDRASTDGRGIFLLWIEPSTDRAIHRQPLLPARSH